MRRWMALAVLVGACSRTEEPAGPPPPGMAFEACVREGLPADQSIPVALIAGEIQLKRIVKCGNAVPKGDAAGIRAVLDEHFRTIAGQLFNAQLLCDLFDRGRRADGKPQLAGCADGTIAAAPEVPEGALVKDMQTRAFDRDRVFYITSCATRWCGGERATG